jgi:hypothetical protein
MVARSSGVGEVWRGAKASVGAKRAARAWPAEGCAEDEAEEGAVADMAVRERGRAGGGGKGGLRENQGGAGGRDGILWRGGDAAAASKRAG